MDLALIWAFIIGLSVFMYVLMDGFDLGIGILFPFAAGEDERDLMMSTVAPVWDGNETWLVMGGGGLLAVFPLAYAIIMPALYFPIILMLIALVFRGVAFEFRFKSHHRLAWGYAFWLGSTVATFCQGLVLGGFIQGFEVDGRRFVGGAFDWLTPFSLVIGVALVAGYALLGATWLILKTEGATRDRYFAMARPLLLVLIGFILLVSLWTPLNYPQIAERWFSWPNLLYLAPVPLITAGLTIGLLYALARRREGLPFVFTLLLFLLSYLGLVISFWPLLVPPSLTIWDTSAAESSQSFLLVGALFLVPFILFYTGYSYFVFRGKVRAGEGYGL